jgi:hypothetical protein
MSFWKSAAKSSPSEGKPPPDTTAAPQEPLPINSEKSLPDPTITVVTAAQPLRRPGTSGTELILTSNRRAASQTFQAARRAERSYKARKRSAAARTAYASAKIHFGAAAHHFKVGMKLTFDVVRSIPYIVEDKRERGRAAAEEKKVERAFSARKKEVVDDSQERKEDDSGQSTEHNAAAGEGHQEKEAGDEARQ